MGAAYVTGFVECIVSELICAVHLLCDHFLVLAISILFCEQHLNYFKLVVLDCGHEWRALVVSVFEERRYPQSFDNVVDYVQVAPEAGPVKVSESSLYFRISSQLVLVSNSHSNLLIVKNSVN